MLLGDEMPTSHPAISVKGFKQDWLDPLKWQIWLYEPKLGESGSGPARKSRPGGHGLTEAIRW